jgi:hypothetical protein
MPTFVKAYEKMKFGRKVQKIFGTQPSGLG